MQNPEKIYKQLFLEKEDLGHMKYIYKIIDKLIFIEVLWKSSHPNTIIKGEY